MKVKRLASTADKNRFFVLLQKLTAPNFAELFIVGDQNFALSGTFINIAENFFVERMWEQGNDGDYYVTEYDS